MGPAGVDPARECLGLVGQMLLLQLLCSALCRAETGCGQTATKPTSACAVESCVSWLSGPSPAALRQLGRQWIWTAFSTVLSVVVIYLKKFFVGHTA